MIIIGILASSLDVGGAAFVQPYIHYPTASEWRLTSITRHSSGTNIVGLGLADQDTFFVPDISSHDGTLSVADLDRITKTDVIDHSSKDLSVINVDSLTQINLTFNTAICPNYVVVRGSENDTDYIESLTVEYLDPEDSIWKIAGTYTRVGADGGNDRQVVEQQELNTRDVIFIQNEYFPALGVAVSKRGNKSGIQFAADTLVVGHTSGSEFSMVCDNCLVLEPTP